MSPGVTALLGSQSRHRLRRSDPELGTSERTLVKSHVRFPLNVRARENSPVDGPPNEPHVSARRHTPSPEKNPKKGKKLFFIYFSEFSSCFDQQSVHFSRAVMGRFDPCV